MATNSALSESEARKQGAKGSQPYPKAPMHPKGQPKFTKATPPAGAASNAKFNAGLAAREKAVASGTSSPPAKTKTAAAVKSGGSEPSRADRQAAAVAAGRARGNDKVGFSLVPSPSATPRTAANTKPVSSGGGSVGKAAAATGAPKVNLPTMGPPPSDEGMAHKGGSPLNGKGKAAAPRGGGGKMGTPAPSGGSARSGLAVGSSDGKTMTTQTAPAKAAAAKGGPNTAFGKAFASARADGKSEFTFGGKSYNTKRADGKPLNGTAQAKADVMKPTPQSGGQSFPTTPAAKSSTGRQSVAVVKATPAAPKFSQTDGVGSTTGTRTYTSNRNYMDREK